MITRGVLYIHAAPAALCPHLEWAVSGVFGDAATLAWTPQPVLAGHFRAELSWQAPVGSAARLVSALRGWQRVRFEVTEEPTATTEGERYAFTPDLGVFRAVMGLNGDVLVGEERLRTVLARARSAVGPSDAPVMSSGAAAADAAPPIDVVAEIERLLGRPWDEELEPYRHAGDGAPVRVLHRVG